MSRINTWNSKKFLLPAVAGLLIVIQGCASVVLQPVDESNKDQTGSFDGRWTITQEKTTGVQYGAGNWVFSCSGKPGPWGRLKVDDGEVSINFKNKERNTFIGKSGQFRFEVPLEIVAEAKGTSDSSVDRGEMTMLLSGSLKKGSGFLTWGIAEFANNGCTTNLKYTRI